MKTPIFAKININSYQGLGPPVLLPSVITGDSHNRWISGVNQVQDLTIPHNLKATAPDMDDTEV